MWCSKNDLVKKDEYNTKIKIIEDITNLLTKNTLNAKLNEVRRDIPSITNFTTATPLNTILNEE